MSRQLMDHANYLKIQKWNALLVLLAVLTTIIISCAIYKLLILAALIALFLISLYVVKRIDKYIALEPCPYDEVNYPSMRLIFQRFFALFWGTCLLPIIIVSFTAFYDKIQLEETLVCLCIGFGSLFGYSEGNLIGVTISNHGIHKRGSFGYRCEQFILFVAYYLLCVIVPARNMFWVR